MGQKVHPTGFRLGYIKDWNSRWFAHSRAFPKLVLQDYQMRTFLKKRLKNASVSKIEISRAAGLVTVTIRTARPGLVIGKRGDEIDRIRQELKELVGVPVQVNVEEVRKPELDAQLVAESIAQQLERRVMHRRAMKRAIQNAMRLGAEGIKVRVSGRLGGAELARSEWYMEGRVPLHTLRADIDYGFAEAHTKYGVIGVKVWIFKGEIFLRGKGEEDAAAKTN